LRVSAPTPAEPPSAEPPSNREFTVVDRRAVRIRRLTSAAILIAGVGFSGIAGLAGGVLSAALTIAVWTIVIVGTLWLFRYARSSG
jgi:hypothetical protein